MSDLIAIAYDSSEYEWAKPVSTVGLGLVTVAATLYVAATT